MNEEDLAYVQQQHTEALTRTAQVMDTHATELRKDAPVIDEHTQTLKGSMPIFEAHIRAMQAFTASMGDFADVGRMDKGVQKLFNLFSAKDPGAAQLFQTAGFNVVKGPDGKFEYKGLKAGTDASEVQGP